LGYTQYGYTKEAMNSERIVKTACSSHCGGECVLRVHLEDGVIARIESDDGPEPQLRACLRCRAYRQRVYDPERLRFPMRRIGERGQGKFERITWDEALDTVVGELNRVRDTHGPAAVFSAGGGGDAQALHSYRHIQELLAMTGGYTTRWGNQSYEGALFGSMATYGTLFSVGTSDNLLHSKLIILWGFNPAVTIQRTNTNWLLAQAKEKGIKIVCVDPRCTDTAASLATQWIPLRPGTDVALLLAMAYVIITQDLQDQAFIDAHTFGFEEFKDYVLGKPDGVAKTPEWAAEITGVPAGSIQDLAREYASAKPAALVAGVAPARSARGEQYERATEILAAITGNTGVIGGWSGRFNPLHFGGYPFKLGRLPASQGNPVEAGASKRKNALITSPGTDNVARIHFSDIADAILEGKAGGYPADIKMMIVMQSNLINQLPNSNKIDRALKELEFVVVAEQVMTATARYADILLPVSTALERNDLTMGGATPLYGLVNQVIEPLYESKNPFDLLLDLSRRLGVSAYSEKTADEWRHTMIEGSADLADFSPSSEEVVYRVPLAEPIAGFRENVRDPNPHPFPTPSGKIEIYSQVLAEMNDPMLPPIPKYLEHWEGHTDALTAKYPLQLITTHFKRRAHTQFDTLPWLRELMPQALSINPTDAEPRGIADGESVRVFNDRGEVLVPVIVTQRIMPGVVDLPEGGEYRPDERGIDTGGCANTLTRDVMSPGGAACHNTCLVQIEKAVPGSRCGSALATLSNG